MEGQTLRSGRVAAEAGVNVETLRFYERRGLLKEPRRRPSGYREYPQEAVRVVRFIKHAQELGFTLHEIEEQLRLRVRRKGTCSTVRAAASSKLEIIEKKMRSLRAIKRALTRLVESCASNDSAMECPILEALDQ